MNMRFNLEGNGGFPGPKVGLAGTKYSMPVFSPEDDAAAAAAETAKGVAAALAAKAAEEAAKAEADKKAADEAAAAKKAEEEALKKSGMSEADAKLLKENMKAKQDLIDAKAKLKLFDGIDPEAVRAMLAERIANEKRDAEAKGDFERVKKMMADESAAALKKAVEETQAANAETAKLNATINDLTVGTAFTGSKFLSDETVLPVSKARAIYGSHFEIEDGVVVGYDKPKGEAERTKLVTAAGKPMPFEVAIKKIIEADPDSDAMLRSKLKGGTGSGTTDSKAMEKNNQGKEPLKGAALMEAIIAKRAADKAKK